MTATKTTTPIYFRALEAESLARGNGAATADWQRARMFHAITRAVSEKGYARITVADVVGLAGVSRRTFYEHFEDIEDCFVASYEAATHELLAEVESAGRAFETADWNARFEVAIAAYLAALASDPYAAQACLVDVLGAGPRAIEARRRVYTQFVSQMRALRHGRRDGKWPVPDIQFHAAVGAIGELVQGHVLEHGADSLPEMTPTLAGIGRALLESRVEFAH